MLKVSFPDGAIKHYDEGITPFQIAESISNSLSKKLLSASYNGKQVESNTELNEDGKIEFHFWDDLKGFQVTSVCPVPNHWLTTAWTLL